VKIGVTKVNINSDMRIAYRNALEKVLVDNPDEYSVAKLVEKAVVEAVQKVVEDKLDDFNSAGRAQP
jgi:fructose/tagatose bisphosphate aldolase